MAQALIISRFFPPLSSAGGSIRLVKFIKYISLYGWKFVVLTQDTKKTVVPEHELSSFLLDELPLDVKIRRVSAPFSVNSTLLDSEGLGRSIGKLIRRILGDTSLGWGIKVFFSGLDDMRKSKVDIIFCVTPPFTNALIAMLLGWIGQKPFVLDLKDDWVGSPTFVQKNAFRQKLETLLEYIIVRRASAVITVTPLSYCLYKERYEKLDISQKFHLIPNGCDLDEYSNLNTLKNRIVSSRFLILSAAWGYRKGYRDITPFLLAFDKFLTNRPDAKGKVDVILLGDSLSNEYDSMISDLDLDGNIHRMDAMRRSDLIDWLWKADLFLLIQPVGNKTAISGTLYEYWATGKAPILLISESGASSALIEDNKIGQHFHFNQIEQIATYIEKIFDAYNNDQPAWIERTGIQNFDRKALAQQMETIWRKALAIKS